MKLKDSLKKTLMSVRSSCQILCMSRIMKDIAFLEKIPSDMDLDEDDLLTLYINWLIFSKKLNVADFGDIKM